MTIVSCVAPSTVPCCLMWYHLSSALFFLDRKWALSSISHNTSKAHIPILPSYHLTCVFYTLGSQGAEARSLLHSRCGPWTRSIGIILELVRDVETMYSLQTHWKSFHFSQDPKGFTGMYKIEKSWTKTFSLKKKFFLVILVSVPQVHLLISTLYLHPTPLSSSPDIESAPSWHRYSHCK